MSEQDLMGMQVCIPSGEIQEVMLSVGSGREWGYRIDLKSPGEIGDSEVHGSVTCDRLVQDPDELRGLAEDLMEKADELEFTQNWYQGEDGDG